MLKYFYITNNPEVAEIADTAGVDLIFIDLEQIGKAERQPMDTVKNFHSIEDVKAVRPYVKNAKLMVRINPLYEGTENEVEKSISYGADVIMLPMWNTAEEIKKLIKIINGRAEILPLLETDDAFNCIDEVLEIDGINKIHIGLNDLSISQGKRFLFELLIDGTVDALAEKCKAKNVKFGIGGVGVVGGKLALPAENIFAEHYRVGSDAVILSRAFCNRNDFNSASEFEFEFKKRINANREYEKALLNQNAAFFTETHAKTKKIISELIK